ncbi:MAG: FeoB-associated Cys-rich membrane protein [Prevotellaceae bacterium]|jgi:Fe-S cluster biogenesis protein NfuA|nr:FeoB-associated Cys-rich membrane protein [Prevotellaceae bacterium]
MLLQWIVVILICTAAFVYAIVKIYKSLKGKNKGCGGCSYSDKCTLKQAVSRKLKV